MMLRLTVLLAVLPLCVAAETPMTGPEFDSYATGKTLGFTLDGDILFGVEQYLPDRRVIWSPLDGTCNDGTWFARDAQICFVYDGDPTEKCWFIYPTDTGIRAEFADPPGSTILFAIDDVVAPLICGDLFS